jgi:hypothetical protein
MSGFHSEIGSFALDGIEPLGASYDDEADVLYLWRGSEPSEGIGVTSDEGIVILFNPSDGEIVGFTLLDWRSKWGESDHIEVTIPEVGSHQPANGSATPKRRVLAAAAR